MLSWCIISLLAAQHVLATAAPDSGDSNGDDGEVREREFRAALAGSDHDVRRSIAALQADVASRLGETARRRDYSCDLVLEVPPSEREPVQMVFVLEPEWLPAAFALILSLLETNGGACAEHGTFRFHLVVPDAAREHIVKRLGRRDPSSPQLNNAIAVHGFKSEHTAAFFDGIGDAFDNMTGWADLRRIQRPANFARFALHEILPVDVRFAFYLDTDFLAAHGPIDGHTNAPLKQAYQAGVAALQTAANSAAKHQPPINATRVGERRLEDDDAPSVVITKDDFDAAAKSWAQNHDREKSINQQLDQLWAALKKGGVQDTAREDSAKFPDGARFGTWLDLSAAVATVPMECTAAGFIEDFVGYKSPDRRSPGYDELVRWLKTWTDKHLRFGGLCFNAGV